MEKMWAVIIFIWLHFQNQKYVCMHANNLGSVQASWLSFGSNSYLMLQSTRNNKLDVRSGKTFGVLTAATLSHI